VLTNTLPEEMLVAREGCQVQNSQSQQKSDLPTLVPPITPSDSNDLIQKALDAFSSTRFLGSDSPCIANCRGCRGDWEILKEEDKGHQIKIGYIADEPMEARALRLSWLQQRETEISAKYYKSVIHFCSVDQYWLDMTQSNWPPTPLFMLKPVILIFSYRIDQFG
ncbi:hypothetical protein CLF_107488, partial [Clonorchis sinensis]